MYEADGVQVYVVQPEGRFLFLTVHETDTGGTVTPEQQAEIIARMLNELTLGTVVIEHDDDIGILDDERCSPSSAMS